MHLFALKYRKYKHFGTHDQPTKKMKQFFKTTFACVLGVFIAGTILIWIGVIMTIGIISVSTVPTYKEKNNTILYLNLKGELNERSKENPLSLLYSEKSEMSLGLDDILKAIQTAKDNDNIKGIYIEANGLFAGYASIDEIRQALLDFKKSGKFILAYGDQYLQKEYYLASVADSIFLNPVGMLDFRGLSASPIFYKNTLDKIGVDMQIFRVGTFKSAVEPYTTTHMSPANREQTEVYLHSIWDHVVQGISQARKLSPRQLNACADSLMLFREETRAVQAGLIDALAYRPQMKQKLARMAHADKYEDLTLASVTEIAGLPRKAPSAQDIIAVVYADGEIDTSPNDGINSRKLVAELDKIGQDAAIKGVVLRVNSPGGSAFGSEQLWEAVDRLKQLKPVAVSMGDYAASGGYYLSCGAHRIFADAATLTGSIGIFGMVPDASALLTDKIGLTFDEVKTNRYGNFPAIHRAMTPGEKAMMQAYVERGYDLFVKRCAQGRGKTADDIRKIAEGRVWTGANAVKLGLVDQIGTLRDAITWVAGRAHTPDYRRVDYPVKKTIYEELLSELGSYSRTSLEKWILGDRYRPLDILKQIQHLDPVQARAEIGHIN